LQKIWANKKNESQNEEENKTVYENEDEKDITNKHIYNNN